MKDIIAKLNKKFPRLNAVDSIEFDGRGGGIWFRQEGELHPDGLPYFDFYGHGVHPDLESTLESFGFFPEPYDAGTLMAYN
jgi:hypothetical protein